MAPYPLDATNICPVVLEKKISTHDERRTAMDANPKQMPIGQLGDLCDKKMKRIQNLYTNKNSYDLT